MWKLCRYLLIFLENLRTHNFILKFPGFNFIQFSHTLHYQELAFKNILYNNNNNKNFVPRMASLQKGFLGQKSQPLNHVYPMLCHETYYQSDKRYASLEGIGSNRGQLDKLLRNLGFESRIKVESMTVQLCLDSEIQNTFFEQARPNAYFLAYFNCQESKMWVYFKVSQAGKKK